MYWRAMRRNSGYTRSARRARAASSPLLQAFKRFVISAEDAPMDNPFSPGHQKIYQNVAVFAVRFRLYQRKENTHETHCNRGTDAQYRCRRRLRTTEAREDDAFGDEPAHYH